MAKLAPDGLITALDIGSSKVSAMIAQKGDGGELVETMRGLAEDLGGLSEAVVSHRRASVQVSLHMGRGWLASMSRQRAV